MVIQDLIGSDNVEVVGPVDSAVLMASAERALGAFMKAVADSFGQKEARLAAEDWLEELDSREELPGLNAYDWRSLTIAAATRLATRVKSRMEEYQLISNTPRPSGGTVYDHQTNERHSHQGRHCGSYARDWVARERRGNRIPKSKARGNEYLPEG